MPVRAGPLVLFTFALALLPGIAETCRGADYKQSLSLFLKGDYAECIDQCAQAIEENSFSESFRLLKLRAEMQLGRFAHARETLDAALQKFPQSILLRWYGLDVCRYGRDVESARRLEDELETLLVQSPGRYRDAASQVVLGRFALRRGAEPKQVIKEVYSEIKRRQPNDPLAWQATGDLALEKHDYALAAESFEQAVRLDPENADCHLGLARSFEASDGGKAQAALEAALAKNPVHAESLLFLADQHIDSERYDDADTVLAQLASVNPHDPRGLAYKAVLAHLRNQPEREQTYRGMALAFFTANPEPDHLIGTKLSRKYRFAEGAEAQRRALSLDPTFRPARIQLAQDLLRLGQDEEGWRLADEVNREDPYNVVAHNLVTLREEMASFKILEQDGIRLRMEPGESAIYGKRVLELLTRAKATLCEKYAVSLDETVIVEVFPRPMDFAIRTFGLPGGAEFLGVCFGRVVTAKSPASQAADPVCWESTLWHEFCHAVTLEKTKNKMPRWLSEGISVYEEGQRDASWGMSVNPQFRPMLLGDDLTPVSQLSGAFLAPKSALHLQFAYFESSLVVEYLIGTYGRDALNAVLDDLATGLPINDCLVRHAGPLEELDKAVTAYARKKAAEMAPLADWTPPELPTRVETVALKAWVTGHKNNYPALERLAIRQIEENDWQAARETLAAMIELHPTASGAGSPYVLLARVHRELGETARELELLETHARLTADDVDAFHRLCVLAAEAGDWERSKMYAAKWLAVQPLAAAPHERMAAAAEGLSDGGLAAESYEALLLLDPLDASDLHFRLARLAEKGGDLALARRHVLLCLDETPRYRAALALLLEITRRIEQNESGEDSRPAPVEPREPPP
jgi:tetratricopeptide (TPR) repeat protein